VAAGLSHTICAKVDRRPPRSPDNGGIEAQMAAADARILRRRSARGQGTDPRLVAPIGSPTCGRAARLPAACLETLERNSKPPHGNRGARPDSRVPLFSGLSSAHAAGRKVNCVGRPFKVSQGGRRVPIDTALCVRYLSIFPWRLQFRSRLGREAQTFGPQSGRKGRLESSRPTSTKNTRAGFARSSILAVRRNADARARQHFANSVSPAMRD
jgi:hypothetical protein